MALGCNIFNMGFLSCFVAYPLLYKPLEKMNKKGLGMVLSSMFALQLGSIMITIEALLSGSIQGNYMSFIYSMTSIHLVLGIIEGGFTSIVYMLKDKKYFLSSVGIVSLLLSGVIANYASNKPDGLEWSLLNLNDSFNAQTQSSLYMLFEMLQAKTSVLFSLDNSYANILGVFAVAILSYLSSITLKSNHNNI